MEITIDYPIKATFQVRGLVPGKTTRKKIDEIRTKKLLWFLNSKVKRRRGALLKKPKSSFVVSKAIVTDKGEFWRIK
jgi:hypothetical protein